MNISEWSIKRPTPVILFFLIITLLGIFSFTKLGIDENPNVDFPIIIANIVQPGASPKELEADVTKKVEDSLIGIAGLEHITSTVTDGSSLTAIEFTVGYPTQTALNDVRDAISKIRQSLPQDINDPSITHPNFSGEPFIVYSIESSSKSVEQLSYLIDNTISREILTVPGVGQVTRAGGLDREIRVELNPERMRALGVTADQISAQIKSLNINVPGGQGEAGSQEQTIRTIGSALTVDQLRSLQISLPTGQNARLDTLGKISDATADVRQIARLDGKPVVSFAVTRAQGASLISTEEGVRKKVSELEKRLPSDIKINLIRTTAKYTHDSYIASRDALFLGAGLAVLVIFVFLRNWQSTIIGALAIPL
ncbi:MAG: efflux RND transporter permease subunit, partial [Candidatus Sericytochromatia bacterium]|nr:efflux RND transporter permease subunit [Candidatus Sericytochromatia bacterium]